MHIKQKTSHVKITSILLGVSIFFVFWPTLRFCGLTIFDCLAPLITLIIIFTKHREKEYKNGSIGLLVFALVLFALSGVISSLTSLNQIEHWIRVAKLIIALLGMVLICYSLISRKVFTLTQTLWFLCISATISSFVCILQGHFGILLSLSSESFSDINSMSRFTGLSEHPIEAGYVATFGALICLYFVMQKKRKLLSILLCFINIYSLRYSGSLTAFVALIGAISVFCVCLKSYKLILGLILLGIVAFVSMQFNEQSSPLGKRIEKIMVSGMEYETIKTRESQWSEAINRMDFFTIALGRGYSRHDLPNNLDIHNGIIASIYHFGLIGLLSQLMFFCFFSLGLRGEITRKDKGLYLAIFFVFFIAYMTGPPFSRRTLWMPIMIISSYLNASCKNNKKRKRTPENFLIKNKGNSFITRLLLPIFVFSLISFYDATPAQAQSEEADIPVVAKQNGYTLKTFYGYFSNKTVDLEKTKKPGYSWYFWDLFGRKADISSVQINDDNSVTLLGDPAKAHGQLVSAVKTANYPHFVGTAFGGGAYIEATIKFDKEAVSNAPADSSVPAFWALQLEGDILEGKGQWPGMPRKYIHNIEVDIFESIRNPKNMPENSYGGSLHDWFGIYNKTCGGDGLCQEKMPYREGMRIVPKDTDFSKYHQYGFLWVPATKETKGKAIFYFDRKQVGPERTWELYTDQPPPPIKKPWAFGIIDQRHLVLILSTGLGQPMSVKDVSVWQKDEKSNLVGY